MGGISTGEDIIIRMALKPPSSISKLQKTLNEKHQEVEVQVKGRHDPCLAPRVVPVAEAMIALRSLMSDDPKSHKFVNPS